MNKHHTTLLEKKTVIHTTFHGEISRSDIIEAIKEWFNLLLEHQAIRYLIFDYTDASLILLSSKDVTVLARQTAELTQANDEIIMIGVMVNDLDFGLFRMWKTMMDIGLSGISENQTYVVRNLDLAFEKITEISFTPLI